MNFKNILKEKLTKYKKENILITNQAEEQALFRNVDLDEVKENIINPKRLSFAEKQKAQNREKKNLIAILDIAKLNAIDTFW